MIRSFGLSDPGPVRKTNEDSFVRDEELRLFVVADGMGGHAAGEVASRLAVEAIAGFMRRSHDDTEFSWPYGVQPTLSFDANRLRTAVCLANRRVFRAAENHDNYTGMGTTVVTALISGTKLVVAHVGDSRVYLFTDGALTRLTQDDSWGATVLAQQPGHTSEALAHHPMRNVLTNVVGAREQTDIHLAEHELPANATVLLCSDGLHGTLNDEGIGQVLRTEGADLEKAARHLVEHALRGGSRDNVTALLVRYERNGHA